MTPARASLARSVAAALAISYAAAAQAADPETEARERFERAVKLYEEGDYDAALVELKRASELRPSYKLYYNIGQVRVAMHDYAAALDAYRKYLDNGGDRVPAARRDQVQKEIKKLEQRVAKLSIETDVPGAEIFVDGASIGVTPLAAPALLNAGTRRLIVRHPDYLPQSRTLSLAGGVQEKVSFSLSTSAPSPAETRAAAPNRTPVKQPTASPLAPLPASPQQDQSSGSGLWVGWAVTGALAAGAAVTGVMALSKNSALSDKRDEAGVSKDELETDAKKVRALAILTDGLAAAALVSGGITLWLTLRSNRAEATTAAVGVGLHGVSFKGQF
jgi:hypothetical protein